MLLLGVLGILSLGLPVLVAGRVALLAAAKNPENLWIVSSSDSPGARASSDTPSIAADRAVPVGDSASIDGQT
jgi:hypothetical protein